MTHATQNESTCCNAPARVAHGCDSDFGYGDKKCNCEIVTCWYECTKCEKPCDVYNEFWKCTTHNAAGNHEAGCPECRKEQVRNESNTGSIVPVEDWEKKFEEDIYIPHSIGCISHEMFTKRCDCNHDEYIFEIKEFIKQQRQEAVKEFAEQLKKKAHFTNGLVKAEGLGLFARLEGWYIVSKKNFKKALEVYEGK